MKIVCVAFEKLDDFLRFIKSEKEIWFNGLVCGKRIVFKSQHDWVLKLEIEGYRISGNAHRNKSNNFERMMSEVKYYFRQCGVV